MLHRPRPSLLLVFPGSPALLRNNDERANLPHIRKLESRKLTLCAALLALVCAIPGRREEAGAQLPASEVDKMHAKLFDERTGRGSLLDRAKHEGDLRITIFPEVGML